VRNAEWQRLARQLIVPQLQPHVDRPVIAHKWWIVVGDVGLVTHAIGTEVAKSPRDVSNYAAVLSLFDTAPGQSDFRRHPGERMPGHQGWIELPEDPEAQGPVVQVLTDRIVKEGLPFLRRYPDLDAIAARLRWLLRNDSLPFEQPRLAHLSALEIVRGNLRAARAAADDLARSVERMTGSARKYGKHSFELAAYIGQLNERAERDLAEAQRSLWELATRQAKARGLPPPPLRPVRPS
jgi:hypothetical protein